VILLLLLGQLAAPALTLTPGVVRPLTTAQVCSIRWGLDHRHVTAAMRRQVFAAYGVPVAQRATRVVDHLVPRELGGRDDVRNLWPQTRAEAHAKDVEENRLHRAVCAGRMTLSAAQQRMRNWGVADGPKP
jgi:hypothetical protein